MANPNTDIATKANGAASEFKNEILMGEHQLEKLAMRAGEQVGAIASGIASTTADSLQSSREYVKGNPTKGVAIAAAAGVVVGSLLTMVLRSRNRKD